MRSDFVRISSVIAIHIIAVATTAHADPVDMTPAGTGNSATSLPLSVFTGHDYEGILVGDKVISGIEYSTVGDMPEPALVTVFGYKDANGNFGVAFQGDFLDLPGGGSADALIRYIVDVTPAAQLQGFKISGARLEIAGVGVGPQSAITVDETFAPESAVTLNALRSTIGGDFTQLNDSDTLLAPLTSMHVTTDILAIASNSGAQPATVTNVSQSFVQIPEPTMLVGTSVFIMLVVRRRR